MLHFSYLYSSSECAGVEFTIYQPGKTLGMGTADHGCYEVVNEKNREGSKLEAQSQVGGGNQKGCFQLEESRYDHLKLCLTVGGMYCFK